MIEKCGIEIKLDLDLELDTNKKKNFTCYAGGRFTRLLHPSSSPKLQETVLTGHISPQFLKHTSDPDITHSSDLEPFPR